MTATATDANILAGDGYSRTNLIQLPGTYRVCDPEVTFEEIVEPAMPKVGITRIADVTWLCDVGISVYQAIRPNSATLSVSQGKGSTPMLAKVSAAMESIELWHAENIAAGTVNSSIGEMSEVLDYDVKDLCLADVYFLHPSRRLEWIEGASLLDGTSTYVPKDYVEMDCRYGNELSLPHFRVTSNGLASGNSREEAIMHGLYEVIERDSEYLFEQSDTAEGSGVDLGTVDDPVNLKLLGLLSEAGMKVAVHDITSRTGIPAFNARIWSESFPSAFGGYGCHLDKSVAFSRALSEAAQSQLTTIAGSRDDIQASRYRRFDNARLPQALSESDSVTPTVDYRDIEGRRCTDLEDDIAYAVSKVVECTGMSPVAVDLTSDDVGVPVVKVVAPGLDFKRK